VARAPAPAGARRAAPRGRARAGVRAGAFADAGLAESALVRTRAEAAVHRAARRSGRHGPRPAARTPRPGRGAGLETEVTDPWT